MLNSKLTVNKYTGTNVGITVTARVQGNVVGLKVRGTTANALGTGSDYVIIGTIPALGNLITNNDVIIDVRSLTSGIFGQLRIEADGRVRVGYTTDRTGASTSIPANTSLYMDTTFVLS